jgi:hypothetical protein
MLKDPLVIAAPTAASFVTIGAIQDWLGALAGEEKLVLRTVDSGASSSARKGTLLDNTKVSQKVSHSLSKENAPFVTERTLVRFDFARISPSTGKPVTASVYTVFALPQGDTFSVADMLRYGNIASIFTLQGAYDAEHVPPRMFDTAIGETTNRLLDGEA